MPNKVAVVTGSNKGIGYAIVKGLCRQLEGFDVLLTARNEDRGKAAVEHLKGEHGVEPKFFQLDISKKDSIENLKRHLKETYGGLDILVNNAGVAFQAGDPEPFAEQAKVTVTCNFNATLDVCDALFPLLRSGARVVHLSSRLSTVSLGKMSNDMRKKFTTMTSLDTLKQEIANFIEVAQTNKHEEQGYSGSALGMSKVGITVMTPLQQAALDADQSRTDILINCCCPGYCSTDTTGHRGHLTIDQGADTPVWLATLPTGTTSPKGDLCAERKIIDWRTKTGW